MGIKLSTPLTYEKIKDLKAGDSILLSGIIYSARDAAHKRLIELLEEGKELPIDVKDASIYYVVAHSSKRRTSYRISRAYN